MAILDEQCLDFLRSLLRLLLRPTTGEGDREDDPEGVAARRPKAVAEVVGGTKGGEK